MIVIVNGTSGRKDGMRESALSSPVVYISDYQYWSVQPRISRGYRSSLGSHTTVRQQREILALAVTAWHSRDFWARGVYSRPFGKELVDIFLFPEPQVILAYDIFVEEPVVLFTEFRHLGPWPHRIDVMDPSNDWQV